jgi:L-asparaginase II/GNAT superfamily N-acetyltransferase
MIGDAPQGGDLPVGGGSWPVAAGVWDALTEPVAAITRGRHVESVHRGIVVTVDPEGTLLGCVGDPAAPVLMRSAAKPFQALALVVTGAADAFGLSSEELAIICASHGGEPRHVDLVEELLNRAGATPADLICGVHRPTSASARRRLDETGGQPTAIHNQCSGKHAGMLLLARRLGVPLKGYERRDHPVQQTIARVIEDLLGADLPDLWDGTDGCGVPVIVLPAVVAATLVARLAAGERADLRRVRDAMCGYPELVGGESNLDTLLMGGGGGRVVAKMGAEGVQSLGLVAEAEGRPAVGCLIKIEDGATRALPAVVSAWLRAWGEDEPAAALGDEDAVLRNWSGTAVGRTICLLDEGALRSVRRQSGSAEVEADAPLTGSGSQPLRPARWGTSWLGKASTELTITIGSDGERDVVRLQREEWPRADEDLLGRAYDWRAERDVFVARLGRVAVGILKANYVGGVATAEELIVRSEHRGRGIGTALLDRYEAEARRRGCHKCVLRTPLHSPAERFYRGRGYRRDSVLSRHHFGHDFAVMRKDLV